MHSSILLQLLLLCLLRGEMKLFDWFALKVKRMLIRVVSPDLKDVDIYWNQIDPQDRYFAGLVLVMFLLVVGSVVVLIV